MVDLNLPFGARIPDPLPAGLRTLRVDGSPTATLPRLPPTVQLVHVTRGALASLGDTDWRALGRLERLNLAHNSLTSFEIDAPPELATLCLDFNPIERFDLRSGKPPLVELSMEGCRLSGVPRCLMRPTWPTLGVLNLARNPIWYVEYTDLAWSRVSLDAMPELEDAAAYGVLTPARLRRARYMLLSKVREGMVDADAARPWTRNVDAADVEVEIERGPVERQTHDNPQNVHLSSNQRFFADSVALLRALPRRGRPADLIAAFVRSRASKGRASKGRASEAPHPPDSNRAGFNRAGFNRSGSNRDGSNRADPSSSDAQALLDRPAPTLLSRLFPCFGIFTTLEYELEFTQLELEFESERLTEKAVGVGPVGVGPVEVGPVEVGPVEVGPVEVRGVRGLGGPARGVRGLGGPAWVKTMLEHCARRDRHSIGLTYADTLALVLNALPASAAEREDAYDVLREEVIAGFGLCFTGRLSRLVNALGGIVDGVGVHLSASEERANAIVRIRRRNAKALGLDTDEYLARTIADVQEMLGAEMDEYECDVWIDAL